MPAQDLGGGPQWPGAGGARPEGVGAPGAALSGKDVAALMWHSYTNLVSSFLDTWQGFTPPAHGAPSLSAARAPGPGAPCPDRGAGGGGAGSGTPPLRTVGYPPLPAGQLPSGLPLSGGDTTDDDLLMVPSAKTRKVGPHPEVRGHAWPGTPVGARDTRRGAFGRAAQPPPPRAAPGAPRPSIPSDRGTGHAGPPPAPAPRRARRISRAAPALARTGTPPRGAGRTATPPTRTTTTPRPR